jgi:hypothetical protein
MRHRGTVSYHPAAVQARSVRRIARLNSLAVPLVIAASMSRAPWRTASVAITALSSTSRSFSRSSWSVRIPWDASLATLRKCSHMQGVSRCAAPRSGRRRRQRRLLRLGERVPGRGWHGCNFSASIRDDYEAVTRLNPAYACSRATLGVAEVGVVGDVSD